MGRDSDKALELVRISKEIQKPLVRNHNGKWLKEMGDGAMARFSTAMDAVNCAIDIQKIARGELDAKLRIGIHLGDVTVEENDVHGDGVNVASRLESIADPGGIYISESIEKAIQGQSNVQAKYVGEVKLKNVAYGVRTYALQGVGLPIPEVKAEKELSGRFLAELQRRGVIRAGATYVVLTLLLILLVPYTRSVVTLPQWSTTVLYIVLTVGLPIALYLAWNYERSPEGFVRTSSQQSWQNSYKGSQKKPLTGSFIIAGMALIIVFMYSYPRYFSSGAGTVVTVDDKSIAVLPFISLSEDAEKQYQADGVMDAILLHLSKIEDLRVITRTSVEKYRNPTQTIPEIARELQVNYILEGSFQKYGDQVKLIVQLSNADEREDHTWASEYDRDWSDIFSVQSEVAQTIAKELHAAITPKEKEIIETIPTSDLTAFDFFLRARDKHASYWEDRNSKNGLEQAIKLYRGALEYDSTYAQAYSGLALSYWDKFEYQTYFEEDYMDSVLSLVNKALSFDDQLDEAYFVRGRYYGDAKGEFSMALSDFDKALQINPNYAWAYREKGVIYTWRLNDYVEGLKNLLMAASLDHSSNLLLNLRSLGQLFTQIGFDDKSLYYQQEALKLDNDSSFYLRMLGNIEIQKGNYKVAVELGKKGYDQDSTNSSLINDLIKWNSVLGNNQEAYNYSLKLIELGGENLFYYNRIGYAFWQVGKQDEAKYYFNEQIRMSLESIRLNRAYAVWKGAEYDLAGLYAFLGEKEKAYQYLDEVDKMSFFPMWWIVLAKNDPMFNSIKEEDRFQQLIRNMEAKNFKEHERVRVWLEEEGML